jgi:ribosomal protein S12 methylthiotransferase
MTKKTSVRVITLGCSKNLVDSEKILGQLPPDRFNIVQEGATKVNIVIINTCGFIQDAKEESIDTILETLEAKKNGLVDEVLVTGCLSERYHDELKKEIPEADAWFGVHQPGDLFDYLQEKYLDDNPRRLLTTPGHYAYLKIAEGCDRTCSFCAIPMIRGAYRSQPINQLVEEAQLLAGKGVKELILIAQDLSYYGYDLTGKSMLGKLIQELTEISGVEWIRLHYAYPHNFPVEVINLMASNQKICRYLDIPLQHIDDEILRSMRRGHSKAGTLSFLEMIRKEVPGLALRTTLMVGYPGETEAAFRELMDFVEQMRFDRLGVFSYSPEEGTRAYAFGDPVPGNVKEERLEAIMELQSGISLQINKNKIGQQFRVMVDREENEYFIGRTEFDSPEVDNEVLITKDSKLTAGQFANVFIDDASEFDLYGHLIS